MVVSVSPDVGYFIFQPSVSVCTARGKGSSPVGQAQMSSWQGIRGRTDLKQSCKEDWRKTFQSEGFPTFNGLSFIASCV